MKKFLLIAGLAAVLCAYERDTLSEPEVTSSDSVIWQQSSVDMITSDEGSPYVDPASVGARLVLSDKTSILVLPLSYRLPSPVLGGRFTLGLAIPWVEREVTPFGFDAYEKVSGMGDISVSAEHDRGNETDLRKISSLIVKFPTGATDEKLSDGTTETTLGSGGRDIAVALTLIKRSGSYRYIANMGYRYNGDWDGYESFGEPSTVDYGDAVNAQAGAEYKYSDQLSPYLHYRLLKKKSTVAAGDDRKDGLLAGDMIVGFRYHMREKLQLSFALEIPVIRDYSSGYDGEKNKKTAFNFGLNRVF